MAIVFQYGSNTLSTEINGNKRLCGDAKFFGVAETVEDFELSFDVWSKRRCCAASNIIRMPGRKVMGVLYEVPDYLLSRETAKPHSRTSFDEIEGEGSNYKRDYIDVCRSDGQIIRALTYTVIQPRKDLRTDANYVRLILAGLREHGISEDYIVRVKALAVANNSEISTEIENL
jgi:hypothetical protein